MAYLLPAGGPVYVRVDWDNDGDYDGTYEDVSADVLPGVDAELGRDQGRILGGPKVPKGSFALTNESRRYAAEYSGSPLHGQLLPGRACVIGRTVGTTTVTMNDAVVTMNDPQALMAGQVDVPIITGRIEEPKESYGYGQRTVHVGVYGTIQRLIDTKISIAYQPAVRTGNAIVQVLVAAGLAADEYVIDGSSQVSGRDMLHWYVDDRPAWDVCREIWATEGPPAALYEDNLGRLNWEGRTYRATVPRFANVQRTFTDTDATYWFADLEYEQAVDTVVNDMRVEVEQQILSATAVVVWEYGDGTFNLTAGAATTFVVSTDAPIVTPQVPQITTDYTVPIGALASVTLTQLGPRSVSVTFTAGGSATQVAPPAGADGWQLRALPLVSVSKTVADGTVNPFDSQSAYGVHAPPQEISSSIWRSLSAAEADGMIDGYLAGYPKPRAAVRMTLVGATGLLLLEILNRQVSDRIHITDSWSGIDLDVSIEQITHQIDALGGHEAVFHCERIVELGWAQWDVDDWDEGIYGQ